MKGYRSIILLVGNAMFAIALGSFLGYFRSMKIRNKKSGFALVEVLIIFVIVVLLAVMTIPVFKKLNEDSNSTSMEQLPIEEQGIPKSY